MCINGTCACFKGYEGESCGQRTYNLNCECSDKCADFCATQCKSTFDTEGRGVGKQCFVGCSRKCFTRCMKGSYQVPKSVGSCETAYCKMLKRTMLDMEGIFSTANKWAEKPEDKSPLVSSEESALLQGEHHIEMPSKLNVHDMSKETSLNADEIEEIVTGKSAPKLSTKVLADSVLFDLSDEDRDALERINKL